MSKNHTPLITALALAALVGWTYSPAVAQEPSKQESPASEQKAAEGKKADAKEATESAEEKGEVAVSLDQLPPQVKKAIEKQVGADGKIIKVVKEADEGLEKYEAEFMKQGIESSIEVATDGSVIEIERKVAVETLPEAVRKALDKVAGGGKVKAAHSVTAYYYEFDVEKDGKTKEVKIDPSGKADVEDDEQAEEHEEKDEKGEHGHHEGKSESSEKKAE